MDPGKIAEILGMLVGAGAVFYVSTRLRAKSDQPPGDMRMRLLVVGVIVLTLIVMSLRRRDPSRMPDVDDAPRELPVTPQDL